ncbi:amino acid--[acyl-carrier-protein] ligase [Pannonibacter sp. SL95]|uniref:amino acid--[acyl-carrier-protein] ligase n=1 Tax=Pannonibacter sp. SL95 TaxID=2995153 RepID=UPI0022759185|nr:amino acid--[acyl-carrier-protein] ligase [Pannonibacter sp. SL95]MCY1707061.1 amino acid--[acyl-carrier-protein] ligase [Pannonibacter sp. SL95]
MDMQTSLLDRLFDAGLLIDTGVDGLYGRSGAFEDVIQRFEGLISAFGSSSPSEVIRFPPGMNRSHFEGSGYMKSFPQLAGTVHSFCGCELDHVNLLQCMAEGNDWTKDQKATDIVLTPAACYPLYQTIAKRGPLPAGGGLFDLQSYCFRHEPSKDPARMQLFRMREYVRMGTPDEVMAFRQQWMERGQELIAAVELPVEIDVANDPFFGRAGKMLANNQRDQALKFELLIPVTSTAKKTACLSFNYHQDHFGKTWGLTTADGAVAHTACVGFGLERIALALFAHHGLDTADWPSTVRKALWG